MASGYSICQQTDISPLVMTLAVTIMAGSCTQGQGHETVFKQIVCDKLGLKPEDVNYIWGDTDKVPFGHGTGGSRTATHGGSAMALAVDKVSEKATKIAAHMLEAAESDIEFKDGAFTVAGTDKSVNIQDVARTAYTPNKMPKGVEDGLFDTASFTPNIPNFPNGCHVSEYRHRRR